MAMVEHHLSYILHRRNYRETSVIIDVLTLEYGRINLISKGALRPRSPLKGILQPFQALQLSWLGDSDMPLLTAAEFLRLEQDLKATALLSGFYINELLVRLLNKSEVDHGLFKLYQSTLTALRQKNINYEAVLRKFELGLLHCLGYGINLHHDIVSNEEIVATAYYKYLPEAGMMKVADKHNDNLETPAHIFEGDSILALRDDVFTTKKQLQDAKRLMRMVMQPLLGNKPLATRKLFIKES